MSNPKPPRKRPRGRAPLSLRLTVHEREILENAASKRSLTISAYVRSLLFSRCASGNNEAELQTSMSPERSRKLLLAQILGKLGNLQPLRNLTDLADAARIGVLPLTPEVVEDIRAACHAIVATRDMLVRALGLKPSGGSRDPER